MKKDLILLFVGASLIVVTNVDSAAKIAYAAESSTAIEQNDSELIEGNRVGFYRKHDHRKKQPLLNQKMDLSSGIKVEKKYPVTLNDDTTQGSYLGSLYYVLSGNLIFGRKAV